MPPALESLQHDIDTVLAGPTLTRSYWGILVRSLKNNDTLYAINAGRLLMPGSAMKVVTLAAAADRLGWDYAYETRLVATGRIDGGLLNGDLVVIGSGDPTLVDRDGSATKYDRVLFAHVADKTVLDYTDFLII